MAQQQQKIKDFKNLPKSSLQAKASVENSEDFGRKLIQRHWHANIGLKESYDLVDRDLWDWNYSIFTGEKLEDDLFYIGKLYELFPCETEKPIVEKLLQLDAWASTNGGQSLLIRQTAFKELLHWIGIFRLPLDVIDFLKWIEEKVVFKIPAFFKARKKFKNYKYYYPYQELYLVYKSNALK